MEVAESIDPGQGVSTHLKTSGLKHTPSGQEELSMRSSEGMKTVTRTPDSIMKDEK